MTTFGLRVDGVELDGWRLAAVGEGVSLSVWVRRVLGAACGGGVDLVVGGGGVVPLVPVSRGVFPGPVVGRLLASGVVVAAGSIPVQPVPLSRGSTRVGRVVPPVVAVSSGSLPGGVIADDVAPVVSASLRVEPDGVFVDRCELRVTHRGGSVCRVCLGSAWL